LKKSGFSLNKKKFGVIAELSLVWNSDHHTHNDAENSPNNIFVIDVQQERVHSHNRMTIIIIIKLEIEFR